MSSRCTASANNTAMPFLGPEHDTRKADSIREEALASLVDAASGLAVYQPTHELRWVDHGPYHYRQLQKRWVCALTGESEWRDVPVVREGEA